MLDNTRNAINRLKKDLSIISWIFTYGVNLFLICYYIFALITNRGKFIINIVLLCITVIFVTVNIINKKKDLSKKHKKDIRSGKHFIKGVKIVTKAYTLGGALYAMYVATTTVNPVEIIFTTLLILLWIIDLLVELVKMFIDFESDRILNGLKKDIEPLIKVKDVVTNTVEHVKDGIEVATSKITNFFHKEDNTNKITRR